MKKNYPVLFASLLFLFVGCTDETAVREFNDRLSREREEKENVSKDLKKSRERLAKAKARAEILTDENFGLKEDAAEREKIIVELRQEIAHMKEMLLKQEEVAANFRRSLTAQKSEKKMLESELDRLAKIFERDVLSNEYYDVYSVASGGEILAGSSMNRSGGGRSIVTPVVTTRYANFVRFNTAKVLCAKNEYNVFRLEVLFDIDSTGISTSNRYRNFAVGLKIFGKGGICLGQSEFPVKKIEKGIAREKQVFVFDTGISSSADIDHVELNLLYGSDWSVKFKSRKRSSKLTQTGIGRR